VALSNEDIERVYREHAREVLAFFMRRVLIAEVAVDLMAETFAQAYRDRRQFRGNGDAEALSWVFGIARHCLGSYVRRGAVERRALRSVGVERRALSDFEYDRIEELGGLREACGRVREGFDQLDAEQRDALRLRVVEERPYVDVAREMGVSVQTARARVSRGLRALRRLQMSTDQGADHA
jgi:RNA polymerase sigma factor (sigma-70 family)